MDVADAISTRRSIRKFLDKDIPDETAEKLINAIRWAPSAGNLQARKFYFVYDKELREMLAVAAFGQMFIARAPLVVVACADHERISHYGKRGRELYSIQDVAVAGENLMLQACELGLGNRMGRGVRRGTGEKGIESAGSFKAGGRDPGRLSGPSANSTEKT